MEKRNLTYLLLFGDLPHAAAAPAAGETAEGLGQRKRRISRNGIPGRIPESKCLVRALAAQRLLCRRGLSSTLYLGCGMEEGKMVAHAWLRFGEMYVTGGDGGGYTTVARFCKEASGKRG